MEVLIRIENKFRPSRTLFDLFFERIQFWNKMMYLGYQFGV